MDEPLPPEIRPLKRGRWRALWTALRLLLALPLFALALAGGNAAASGVRPTLILSAAAVGLAWLGLRSVKQTWRVHRGLAVESGSRGDVLVTLGTLAGGLSVLVAIAIPKFSDLVRSTPEGAAKGKMGAIRSALSIYYGDMDGYYPLDPHALTVAGKYLSAIPQATKLVHHPDSARVRYGTTSDDAGGWLYANAPGDANFGTLWVNCTHTDRKGAVWTTY